MRPLPITVPLGIGQTPISFASSLAAANGVPTMRDFCRHVAVDRKGMGRGELRQIKRLARLGDVDPTQLETSWIVRKDGWTFVGGEKLRRQCSLKGFRYCPLCIQDDLSNRAGPRYARPFLRASWMIEAVGTCVIHTTSLVQSRGPVDKYLDDDFAAYVRQHRGEVDRFAAEARPVARSSADAWMHQRLVCHSDPSFLGSLQFHVALRLCEVIGFIELNGVKASARNFEGAALREARERGYRIAAGGVDAIRLFLEKLDTAFWEATHVIGGARLYGPLYRWLQGTMSNPDFDPVRKVIKDHAIDSFPIGPGDVFLGPVEHRRWHSVHSASREYRVHPKRLRKQLEVQGIIGDLAGRSNGRIAFETSAAAGFLTQVSDRVFAPEARRRLQVSAEGFRQLMNEGLVAPLTVRKGGGMHIQYSERQLDEFLKCLAAKAIERNGGETDLVSVQRATSLAGCRFIEVIRLILGRKLDRLELDVSRVGFLALLVCPTEVRKKTVLKNHGGHSLRAVEQRLKTTTNTVRRLVDGGWLPSTDAVNPIKRCTQRVVMPLDIEEFLERYVSLHRLAAASNMQIAALKGQLLAAGIRPAFHLGPGTATFYETSQLASAGPPSLRGRTVR
ncbi:TniQ family protein [Mesorhizobium sp. NZP2298]|uniref:TniQ family protein n=1 Tax=Mesorhizobium sp. NZP2298 TaxID=2483403 RepID=UPI0015518F98|nr:TniQ family protein [Mesorhizobium sp. NZP2298]